MKKLILLSILLIVGCEETTAPTPTLGCLDGQAANYDATASIDNNTCTYIDSCGVIDIDLTNDCAMDCADEWGGTAVLDNCGICNGNNATCIDCADVWGGTASIDECGICTGGMTGLDPNYLKDACGVCGGDDTIPEGYCDCNGNVYDCNDVCGSEDAICTPITYLYENCEITLKYSWTFTASPYTKIQYNCFVTNTGDNTITDILLQFSVVGNSNTILEGPLVAKYDTEIVSGDSIHFTYQAAALNVESPVTSVEFCPNCMYARLECSN